MCKTCNNEGGLTLEKEWGIEFVPCPDSHCDFDLRKHEQEIDDKFKDLGVYHERI